MKKRNLIITLAALSILCLSGCHKDKTDPTEPSPLETIQPDTVSETISDKLDEPDTYKIETAPSPKAIGINENGETEVSDDSQADTETLSAEEESKKAIEESSLAEENQQKLEEIQESVSESITASDETLSASDYQAINDAIDEYNKKQVEEWMKDMPEYK